MDNRYEKRHYYNPTTFVCSCGKTKEKHVDIELLTEKWRIENFEGRPNFKQMNEEFERLLNSSQHI